MRRNLSLFAFLGMAALALGQNLRGAEDGEDRMLKAPEGPPPIQEEEGPACLDSLTNGDVSVDLSLNGESAWVTNHEYFIMNSLLITNTGKKDICNVELFIPTPMEVSNSYGGKVSVISGGLTATFPDWLAKLSPNQANSLGYILKGEAGALGTVCVTKIESC